MAMSESEVRKEIAKEHRVYDGNERGYRRTPCNSYEDDEDDIDEEVDYGAI